MNLFGDKRAKGMRISYLFTITIALSSLLNACASPRYPTQLASNLIHRQTIKTTTKELYPPKNPILVTLYHPEKKILTPYKVIGVAKVSKYNLVGVKREEPIIHEMMKKLAASIGGDGLIDLNTNNDAMQANVIAYQKILI